MGQRQRPRVRVVASAAEPHRKKPALVRPLTIVVVALIAFAIGRFTVPSQHVIAEAPAGPGPDHVIAGVPVRFARTRAGAVAALLNYGAVLGDPKVLTDPPRRAQVLSLVATPRYAATFTGPNAAAFNKVRRGPIGGALAAGARTAYLASPIAYRVGSYTPEQAVVAGWGVAIVGNDQGVKPQATWGTTLTTARWQSGDWKVDAVRTTDGPTPITAAGHPPSNPADFLARLSGFSGVRHAP